MGGALQHGPDGHIACSRWGLLTHVAKAVRLSAAQGGRVVFHPPSQQRRGCAEWEPGGASFRACCAHLCLPRMSLRPPCSAAPNFVNIDFVNCQFVIAAGTGAPAVFINCVFRETMGRPVIVVQGGGQVIVKASLFYNNSNSNQNAAFGGNGSAIYVQARGRVMEISDSVFMFNGNG